MKPVSCTMVVNSRNKPRWLDASALQPVLRLEERATRAVAQSTCQQPGCERGLGAPLHAGSLLEGITHVLVDAHSDPEGSTEACHPPCKTGAPKATDQSLRADDPCAKL
eukprot:CAMPEP_0115537136 /NCGR_PEP_ID=MMETSP0271-20121206/88165_1 /TAXON_ID=71861 /ORGANISM="Scrippsiella trochoidea, Strain CCMP3099" /LENGTH=108 /DNA_ID=CAMNT_0002969907 /DNA_START=567 /DNA_END=892 /DNA_ORIENTATION=-